MNLKLNQEGLNFSLRVQLNWFQCNLEKAKSNSAIFNHLALKAGQHYRYQNYGYRKVYIGIDSHKRSRPVSLDLF